MTDMLVKLYNRSPDTINSCPPGCVIQRALAIDAATVCEFVAEQFSDISEGWVDECRACLYRQPTTCFIAIVDKTVIGFACYDATAKGMVGPLGVHPDNRGKGIATLLLDACFQAMQADGYAYAVIGWVSSTGFYEKVCGAIEIPDSFPGIYSRMPIHN